MGNKAMPAPRAIALIPRIRALCIGGFQFLKGKASTLSKNCPLTMVAARQASFPRVRLRSGTGHFETSARKSLRLSQSSAAAIAKFATVF